MIKKRGGVDAPPNKTNCGRRISRNKQTCQVAYYTQGVALKVSCPIVHKTGGGIRGKVTEWSTSSRRRLREVLLTHEAPEGYITYDVTLTVPGPNLTVQEMRKLCDSFRLRLKRLPVGVIWRLEVQKRGAVHWHCLVVSPAKLNHNFKDDDSTIDMYLSAKNAKQNIRGMWLQSLNDLGECEFPAHVVEGENRGKKYSYEVPEQKGLRSTFKKADIVSVTFGEDLRQGRVKNAGAWLRYMQDHTSKNKQEQIQEGFGRHWGIWGKQHFVKKEAFQVVDMEPKQYFRFLRAYRRMCTPSYPDESKPFGRSLGYRPSRGARGQSVWFSKPESVKRLQEWATSQDN